MKKTSHKDLIIFSIWFLTIFTISFTVLYVIGFIPKELNESGKETVVDTLRYNAIEAISDNTSIIEEEGVVPIKLIIPSVKIDINIENPSTTDPVLLDEYLKKGIVRYPGSGLLGKGNTLLFGHSSNWEVVKNPNYKALNGIEKLKEGDEIYVESADARYVYKVQTVRMAKAEDIKVDFGNTLNMITLSTCNTFGAKQDRYVIEAKFDRKGSR